MEMDAHVKAYEDDKKYLSIVYGIGLPSEPKIYVDMHGNEYPDGMSVGDLLSKAEANANPYALEA